MQYITEREIAEQIGVTRQAVNAKVLRKGVKPCKAFGRTKVYTLDQVAPLFPQFSISQNS